MRRIWVMCAALVLLVGVGAGCSSRSAPNQTEIKQAFIRQLVGYCAEVDRQLAKVDAKMEPGVVADQFARFVSQARSQPPPDVDREQFKTMMAEFDAIVRDFRAAQTALAAGDQRAAQEAVAQGMQQIGRTNAAAQKYGMPPLDTCPQHESTTAPPTPSPSAPAPTAGWQLRHAALQAVQQIGGAVLDGRIWVAGGLTTPTKATAATQYYDPTINSWGSGPPLPQAVHHAMLVTYRNQLVLIGGFVPRGGDPLAVTSAQVLFLNPDTGHWVPGAPLHHARAAGAAAVVGDKIVVVGGRTGNPQQLVSQTEVYDGTAWHDAADIPVPGDHLAAASDRSYLYAVGGRKFTASTNTAAVQRYDPATDQWTSLTAMPKPVSGAGAAIIDGQLLVAGGEGVTTVSSTVLAYDLTVPTAAWTTLPSLTQGRHGLAVAAIGHTLYAIGGSTRPGHTASTNTVGALKVARRAHPAARWQVRQESMEKVQQIGGAVLNGWIWVAGGLTTPTKATAATQYYDPTINSWGSGPPLPQAVHHAMLVTYRNQLVLIGGFVPRGGDPLAVTSAQVLFLNPDTGHWVPGAPLHHARAAGAAAVVGDKIVVVGGRTGNPQQLVSQTEVYDGTAWHDAADIPVPGDHLAAASDRSYLYAVGGRKFTASTNTAAVQRYDPATDQWTSLTAMPKPVSGAGAAIIDGQLLVAGGEGVTTVSSTVLAYDLTVPTAAWTTLPSLTQGRHGLAVAAIGHTLYAIGGSTRPGHTASTNTVGALTFS